MPELDKGVIVGGGFAGLAAAYWFREQNGTAPLVLLEKEDELLPWLDRKGLEQVTAGDPWGPGFPLVGRYSRGLPELERLLAGWAGSVNLDWLKSLGMKLQEDEDGVASFSRDTDLRARWCDLLSKREVKILTGFSLEEISRQPDQSFRIWSRDGQSLEADGLLLATGGQRNHGLSLARELGHETVPVEAGFVRLRLASQRMATQLGPISRKVGLKCLKSGQESSGLLTLSGRGIEGPVVSSLSVRMATLWHQLGYKLKVEIDWLPDRSSGDVVRDVQSRAEQGGRALVGEDPLFGFSSRQWRYLLKQSKVDFELSWGKTKQRQLQALAQQVKRSVVNVAGAGLPQGERAWLGGIHKDSVDWSSGKSTKSSHVWLAGEMLDFLGMPGGPHLNALWASAYQAGSSMGIELKR